MKLLLVEGERRMAYYGISHCKPKPNSRKGKIGVSCHDGKRGEKHAGGLSF